MYVFHYVALQRVIMAALYQVFLLLKSSSFHVIRCWTLLCLQWPGSKCICVCVCDRRRWCSVRGSSGWAWSSSQSPRWSLTWPTKCESSLLAHHYSNTGNSYRFQDIPAPKFCYKLPRKCSFGRFCEYSVGNVYVWLRSQQIQCVRSKFAKLEVLFSWVFLTSVYEGSVMLNHLSLAVRRMILILF